MRKRIIFLLVISLLLVVFFFSLPNYDPNIVGNPDFEPILNNLTKEQLFENIESVNGTKGIKIDTNQFESEENKLVYQYSDIFSITVDLYSNDKIGTVYLNSTNALNEKFLNNELKPIAIFLILSTSDSTIEASESIINAMDLNLNDDSFEMSNDGNVFYEFYELDNREYYFTIRTSAMGH
ncbi:MAG: hypothetical protein U9N10_01605 [Bacillota bacterium]|nr:hypothetical protein [Bacillota bacterium]